MSYFYDILPLMKPVRLHRLLERELNELDLDTRIRVAELLDLLSKGENLGMPVSRPMPVVAHGVHELRIKDRSGQYRIFYYVKHKDALLVFHLFKKKTQEAPAKELDLARKRLGEML